MSGLHTLRSRLGRLRWRRAWARSQTALARLVVLFVIALFVLLAIDFLFRPPISFRALCIAAVGLAVAWQAARRILPAWWQFEDSVDMALLLERTQHVENDLVAALQFDASSREQSGSRELRRAVVKRAAQIAETLDFRSAVPRREVRRASSYAAVAVLFVVAGWFTFPAHGAAFWNRLCLGDARYPTRTRIDRVAVNGRTDAARGVEGEAVVFEIRCSGVTPAEGLLRLKGLESGEATSIALQRSDDSSGAVYVADTPPINEPIEFSLRIGDTETEPRRMALVHRPLVELTIEAEPPAYMRRDIRRQSEHYLQVLENSSVRFWLRCTNGKRLTAVSFDVRDADRADSPVRTKAFVPTDASRGNWRLDPEASGLTRVVTEFSFRITVLDEDGLGTYHPVEGAVRVQPDRPPSIMLSSLHHAVLPQARPTVSYAAEDDFGLASVVLRARNASTRSMDVEVDGTLAVKLPLPASGTAPPKDIRAEYSLDLSPLQLVEHDKLLVWIEAVDHRGAWAGMTTVSDTIEFEVADERSVLDAILRSDADAEQMLTEAIEKELGLRGDR